MDHLARLRASLRQHIIELLLAENIIVLVVAWLCQLSGLSIITSVGIALAVGVIFSLLVSIFISNYATEPLRVVWQAVLHLSPDQHGTPAPQPEKLGLGRELVTTLISQIYQFAKLVDTAAKAEQQSRSDLHRNFIAQNLPLPLIVIDPSETITFANDHAAQYIGMASEDMVGKSIYMVLDMSFPSEDTFDVWLKSVKLKSATALNSWERVRLNVRDNHPTLLFDLAAYYNRDNPDHHETMLVLFDHTKQYSQDEQAVSFVALSVHELRTPLTLLRGYIEVFQEELGEKIDDELKGFMQKMQSQAEQLTAFVNNILNVARVEDDQLELQLQEQDWSQILKNAVEAISLRAKVRGITLNCSIQQGLPAVGVDALSIREVINNLVDNAIKYSGNSKTIEIKSYLNQEGLIETTVQDYGLGIPTSIMPNLFTKFYRDHRNRAQIGGTGLGLYLSKAIVDAHGGTIWVRSKENEGSVFGFTLMPYAQLTEEMKRSGNKEIIRSAHGWIKNHSLYRR